MAQIAIPDVRLPWKPWMDRLIQDCNLAPQEPDLDCGCGGFIPVWPRPQWMPGAGTDYSLMKLADNLLSNAGDMHVVPDKPEHDAYASANMGLGTTLQGFVDASGYVLEAQVPMLEAMRAIYRHKCLDNPAIPRPVLKGSVPFHAQRALKYALWLIMVGAGRYVSADQLKFLQLYLETAFDPS